MMSTSAVPLSIKKRLAVLAIHGTSCAEAKEIPLRQRQRVLPNRHNRFPTVLGKNGIFMKLSKSFQRLLAGSIFLLATSAFATDKGTLHVSSLEKVPGGALAAGDYTVQWEDAGPSIKLKIMQGKKVIATVPAKVVPLSEVVGDDTAVISIDADGSRRLSRVLFRGKKFALEIENDTDNAHVDPNS